MKVGKSVSLIRAFGASPDLSSKHVVCSLAASDPQKMAKDGFKYFLFSHLDLYFSNGLKPPTRYAATNIIHSVVVLFAEDPTVPAGPLLF